MRKALKAKALLLFISWFMIFMHGVIPHLHDNHTAYDPTTKGSDHLNCIHSQILSSAGDDLGMHFINSHEHNSSICHFNPNLFSQLDIDYLFVFSPVCNFVFSDVFTDIQKPDTQSRYKKPPHLASNALRAPPLV